jgi:cytoskeleton protein RodZ
MALFQRIKTPFAVIGPENETLAGFGLRSAGEVLREQRERLGLDLVQIAASLRIKPAYLAALEEGCPDRLPGPAYAVGFVRAYSDYLGLDSPEILRRFKLEAAGLDAKPDLSFPMPLAEHSVPGGKTLLVALILAICGYGTWYYLSTAERERPQRVTEVPAALLPAKSEPSAGGPVSKSLSTPPHAISAGGQEASPSTVSAKPSAAEAATGAPAVLSPLSSMAGAALSAPPPSVSAAVAAAGVAAPVPPAAEVSPASPLSPPSPQNNALRTYGDVSPSSRIVLRATSDSWIQVRNADRSVLFTGVLKPGESYRVPDTPGVAMRTGNAGGLEVIVDGKPAPSLGPIGAVRGDVALDPQALTAGSAIHN